MDRASYVALALVPGIGPARLSALLAAFRTAQAVLAASFKQLRDVDGMNAAAATAIGAASARDGQRLLDQATELGAVTLVPEDAHFPKRLKVIPDAPTLLFALGRLDLLDRPCLAIVGARSHSRYGAEVCRHFAGGVAGFGVTVVSGMARGLDAVAHAAALDAGGGTVGVLGNGLGVIYPAANRHLYERVARDGCLLTEYAPGERPHAGSFPRRNRLISGLAQATVVIEARDGSGALITAESALTQGRDVLAVPGPITSPLSNGCNRLIQTGAKPALGLRDLLEELDIVYDPAVPAVTLPSGLTDSERRLMDLLDSGAEHVDDLATRLGAPAAEALALLTSLEIRGLVAQAPGKIFSRVSPLMHTPKRREEG
ncbi:MAG: DNA-protecting protein DprA [Gemmatimonadetes bacterium]|nr:DNA-protecting protein DprA [Gemmatimonadota bacterium]